MQFNSWQFAVFLPIVFFAYYGLKHKYRWILLLIASYYFYMSWNPRLIVLIGGTTLISYICAMKVEDSQEKSRKKAWMMAALISCLGVLFFFKYFNFFSESVTALLRMLSLPVQDVTLQLILPVGISFYTFQTLSYVIDVYRGDLKAERHLGYYALYVSCFPQLVAGPIERPGNLIPQLKRETEFNYENVTRGLKIMAWGFYKKLVIATTMSVYVDMVYNDPQNHVGFAMVVATVMFAFQVYCDFSGYSDIAIGSAKMFGQDLMINFKSPYFSKSMKEFWSRWHISLSTWFRDYLYIPLGGNRVSRFRHELNLFITFVVSGLWHGANWTFVAWGGVHGGLQVLENEWKRWKKKHFTESGQEDKKGWKGILLGAVQTVFTFAAVCFAWIFFRANSIGDALFIIRNMFRNCRFFLPYLWEGYRFLELTKAKVAGILIPLLILAVYDYFDKRTDVIGNISRLKTGWRWTIYVMFVTLTICLVVSSQGNVSQEFIYFQF